MQRQMTQVQLAGDSVSRNMVSLIEHGRATPSIQTLEAIAEKLKVSAAFLAADDGEQAILLKAEKLSDIRLAFKGGNYRICVDLCQRLYEYGSGNDDELDLILAESFLAVAREGFSGDQLRACCLWLDEAVFYAKRTAYHSEHVISAAWTYFEYLRYLSPSFVSENLDSDYVPQQIPRADVYCRYIEMLLGKGGSDFAITPSDSPAATLLAKHIFARGEMEKGNFEVAGNAISEIFHSPDLLPGVIMYHVFCDMEECCRYLGNQKTEAYCRETKLSLFEKLLS